MGGGGCLVSSMAGTGRKKREREREVLTVGNFDLI